MVTMGLWGKESQRDDLSAENHVDSDGDNDDDELCGFSGGW